MTEFRLETDRLVLREWREADKEPFWQLSLDPEVMRYLPSRTRDETDEAVDRQMATQAAHGHCLWALESRPSGRFIGFCGIMPRRPPLSELEIGGRLERASWGKGVALEAARACLDWAWRLCGASSIVAITVPANERSWRLMERLGMSRQPDEDFEHPDLAEGDSLRPHILYRIRRPQ